MKQQIIRCLRMHENGSEVIMNHDMQDLGQVVVQEHMLNEEDIEEEAVRTMVCAEGM